MNQTNRVIYSRRIRWEELDKKKKHFEWLGFQNIEFIPTPEGYDLVADRKEETK
jgi:hypothetical protein